MNRRIVELDALTYADGAAAQYDNGLFIGRMRADEVAGFVRAVISGVEVRGLRRKLGRAGIDHRVARGQLLLQLLLLL